MSDKDEISLGGLLLGLLGLVALAHLLGRKQCQYCGAYNAGTNPVCISCGRSLQ